MDTIHLKLPSVVNRLKYDNNYLYHTVVNYSSGDFKVENRENYLKLIQTDQEIIIIDSKSNIDLKGFKHILEISDIGERNSRLIEQVEKGIWVKHPRINAESIADQNTLDISKSWKNNFFNINGLRNPQLGALSSVLAHWTISNDPATIVMPTGTGKTETMLSVMVAAKLEKVLVIVPSNALRGQISDKFILLGILAELGLIEDILYPVVGVMNSKFKEVKDLEVFLSKCNVVVTTMPLISGYKDHMKEKIAEEFDCLIIDEAHHVPAVTWNNFKGFFEDKKILQFTATPFRNDGKHIDGKIIYNYPLLQAQEEGYFQPINFIPLEEYDDIKSDETIVKYAVKQLEEDLQQNYDHVLMARVKSSDRADEVYEFYRKFTQYKPVKIYSSMPKRVQEKVLQQIKSRESRIIVCVNMLGEGFDLPNLKIAALHDKHQSLAVTLQFIGRFTRTSKKLGNATLVANIANEKINEQIEELYQFDSDWNQLISQKSTETIDKRINLDQIAEGFEGQIKELSIQEIRPKTSTVLYKTNFPKWTPRELEKSIENVENTIVMRNDKLNILIVVQKKKVNVPWSKSKDFHDIIWEASIFYWDPEKQLLFVNNSNNQWLDQWIKKLVVNPIRLNRESTFNSFYGVNRLQLNTVGLNEAVEGPLRYRMYTGADIAESISSAEKRTSVKSNIFGVGYENGEQISVGASYKGKVWSRSSSDLPSWIEWCNRTGEKLINNEINVDEIMKGVLKPVVLKVLHSELPISVDWPLLLFEGKYFSAKLKFDNVAYYLFELSIIFCSRDEKNGYIFKIESDKYSAEYSMSIEDGTARYNHIKGPKVTIKYAATRPEVLLHEFFENDDVIFRFLDTSYLAGNYYIKVPEKEHIFDEKKIEVWDWKEINIKKESQYDTTTKSIREDSIQYNVIQKLKSTKEYSVIFDDDGSGEAADIIAIYEKDKKIYIEFYHCKYSAEMKPGARVSDLYEVCGQSNKSVDWKKDISKLITHMKRRESLRYKKGGRSRFEVGSQKTISILEKKLNYYKSQLNVIVVQPGVSKSKVSNPQLEVLGSTEHYLLSTYQIGFKVIMSE